MRRILIPAVYFCCSFQPLHAQEVEDNANQDFPDLFAEGLAPQSYPGGSFERARHDFVLCRGKTGKGDPPPGRPEEQVEGLSAGAYNNAVIEDVIRDIDATDAGSAFRKKHLTIALEKMKIGLKVDPQFFPFLYNSGRLLLLLNLPEQALSYLLLARARLSEFSAVHLFIGAAHARLGDGISATESYRVAYRRNPFDPSALVALGDFYLESGAFPQAHDTYERVLKQFPENASARIGLGRLYAKKGEFVRARTFFESVVTENQDGSERSDYDRALHFYFAEVCFSLKDYREAVKQYDRILKHPEDPFFLDNSLTLMKKRREIARKLAEE